MGAEILNQLTGQGFKFAVKQGQLFVEPKHRLSNEARALIREHKAELLAVLKQPTEAAKTRTPFTDTDMDPIKAHKPAILAALERHDDAEDLREAFEKRAQNAKAEGADLTALLTEACQGVPGIDAATFRSLLSPEDIEDIEGGHIPMITLNAYARSFAEGIRCGRITVLAKAILTSRVRCADCRHFERDAIGDGAGIGDCKVQGEGTTHRQPALWPNVRRWCKDFESREGAA
ncbi:MAG: hypothetical protein ACREYF_06185 [Gammaproteobacteria bacterium]